MEGKLPIRINYDQRSGGLLEYRGLRKMIDENDRLRNKIMDEIASKPISVVEKLTEMQNYFLENFQYSYDLVFDCSPKYYEFYLDGENYEAIAMPSHVMEMHGLSPNVYVVKAGQCTTFAEEMKYFATQKLGLQAIVVKSQAPCYDKQNSREVMTGHVYNKIKIDGNIYELDIARAIMERDKCHENADALKRDISEFLLHPIEQQM